MKAFAVLAGAPATITETIRSGLKEQCPNSGGPVILQVQSHHDAQVSQCYAAVQSYLSEVPEGVEAKPVFGWLIWEQEGVFLNFEHHVVAEVNGTLRDVAKHIGGERVIVFAPDVTATVPFDNPGTNPLIGSNRYHALSDSALVQRIVELKRRNDQVSRTLMLKGKTHSEIWKNWEYKSNDDKTYNLFLLLEKRKKKQKARQKRM